MKRNQPLCVSNLVCLLAVALSIADAASLRAEPSTAQTAPLPAFPHPDRIRYDSQCVTIDGKDMVIFSGAFHYFRCPKALWADRFAKIKEAGFNTVESYTPWNWHEQQMPADVNDFSKVNLDDLRDWLKMAIDQFGLYVIIRPGPYICAEWTTGGYPRWLFNKEPKNAGTWFRTDDPSYLQWCKHWYDAVCPVIAPWQVTRRAPGTHGVILFQIENEYNYWGASGQTKTKSLRALYQDAVGDGIDVPIFTCMTEQSRGSKDDLLHNVFDANNEYVYWATNAVEHNLDHLHQVQPNAPLMISELQGGWFAGIGEHLPDDPHGLGPGQITALTMAAWSHNARLTNYYMLFGGTNPDGWNGRGITTTYDYYAPIRECGGVGEKYAAVKALGQFVTERGEGLARAKLIPSQVDGKPQGTYVAVDRGADGALYLFCTLTESSRKLQTLMVRTDDDAAITIHPSDAPNDQTILYLPPGKTDSTAGVWYLKPAELPQRPANLPAAIRLDSALKRVDAGGVDFSPLPDGGQSLTAMQKDDRTFYDYRAAVHPDDAELKNGALLTMDLYTTDQVRVSVNGKLAPLVSTGNEYQCVADLTGLLHDGDNAVEMLYNDQGNYNFGTVGTVQGIRGASIRSRPALDLTLKPWRAKWMPDDAAAQAAVAADAPDNDWGAFDLTAQALAAANALNQPGAAPLEHPAIRVLYGKTGTAVFRTTLSLDAQAIAQGHLELAFQVIHGSSEIYLNGQKIGGARNDAHDLAVPLKDAARQGDNVLAVKITNHKGDGGLKGEVELTGGAKPSPTQLNLELAGDTGGRQGQWSAPSTDTSAWTKIPLDTSLDIPLQSKSLPRPKDGDASQSAALLTWYRCDFSLPAAPADAWIPWRARIAAIGNGYLFLNGHPLGRYWTQGPQREYYLPECWLNFGPGSANTLVLALRPSGEAASLSAVEIAPYEDLAERRTAK